VKKYMLRNRWLQRLSRILRKQDRPRQAQRPLQGTAVDGRGQFERQRESRRRSRWSQAQERRVGAGLSASRLPTLPFDGYTSLVASLDRGMDLRQFLLARAATLA
jgi:hypothetical protein